MSLYQKAADVRVGGNCSVDSSGECSVRRLLQLSRLWRNYVVLWYKQYSVQIKTLRMCVSSDPVIVVTPSPSLLPAGTFCGRVWDGGLCWDETPAGTSVTQNCPDQPDLGPPGERDSCSLDRMWWKKIENVSCK